MLAVFALFSLEAGVTTEGRMVTLGGAGDVSRILLLAVIILTVLLGCIGYLNGTRLAMRRSFKVLQSLPGQVIICSRDGKILYSHAGLGENALPVGKYLYEFPETDWPEISTALEIVCKTGKRGQLACRCAGMQRSVTLAPADRKWFGRDTVICLALDNSELQNSRLLAEENAKRLELTLRSIGDAVLTTDGNGCITMLNKVAERLTGYGQSFALGKSVNDILHIVSGDEGAADLVGNILSSGNAVESGKNAELLSSDGTKRHIFEDAAPIHDTGGKLIGVILVFRDISGEYEKHIRLRHALKMLDYASDLSRSAAFLLELDSNRISGSRQLPELWPSRDGVALPRKDWVYPEDLPVVRRKIRELVDGKTENVEIDFRSLGSEGIKYFRIKAGLEHSGVASAKLVGVIQDVSGIARAAGELKETLELWDTVINSVPLMFFVKDVNDHFRYVLANRSFEEFTGKTHDEIIRSTDDAIFDSETAEKFRESDLSALASRECVICEHTMRDASGRIRRFRNFNKFFLGANGRKLILGASIDITELKNLVESERINNEMLSHIVSEPDSSLVQDHIADTLRNQLKCDRVMLAVCNDDGMLRLSREWKEDSMVSIRDVGLEQHYRLWDKNIDVMRSNQVLKIADLQTCELTQSLVLFGEQKHVSVMIAPIFVNRVLWGAVFVSFSSCVRSFSSIDESIIRACANMIALAQARKQRKEQLEETHRILESLLANLPVGVVVKDVGNNFRYLMCNKEFCKITGMEKASLLGKTDEEAGLFPGRAEETRRLDQLVTQREESMHTTQEINFTGSEKRIYERFKIPLKLASGRQLLLVSYLDVTDLNSFIANEKILNRCMMELVQDKDSPADSAQLVLRSVCTRLQASRCYVMRYDECNNVVPVFESRFDEKVPSLLQLKPFPLDRQGEWFRLLAAHGVMSVPDTENPEFVHRYSLPAAVYNSYHICSLYLAPIFVNGLNWGFLGIAYENGHHVASEQEMQFMQSGAHLMELMLERDQGHQRILDALNHAQAADKAKSFFIASVSHEIRTPLNAVIGFAELLRDSTVDPQTRKEYLDSIAYGGNALLQLINDVLDLSKLEAGQMEIQTEIFHFQTLAQEVMRVFQFRASERGNTLKMELPVLPPLCLDKLRIRQILFNLIGNAVKFTQNGTVTLTASFMREKDHCGTFEFCVRDSGVGISPEDQEKLMEPFVQLSRIRGTNATNNGTGLGLSISKRLAQRMGGKLWLKSSPGEGSTFGVTLFHVKWEEPEVSEECASAPLPILKPAAFSAPASSIQKNLESLVLLLVDDVPMNLKVMRAMLRRIGIQNAILVNSGAAALDAVKTQTFDAVLTDMWMPGMNGSELAENLRRTLAQKTPPIIAVTADIEAQADFPMDAFSGVLLKPVTVEKLKKMLHSLLETPSSK